MQIDQENEERKKHFKHIIQGWKLVKIEFKNKNNWASAKNNWFLIKKVYSIQNDSKIVVEQCTCVRVQSYLYMLFVLYVLLAL